MGDQEYIATCTSIEKGGSWSGKLLRERFKLRSCMSYDPGEADSYSSQLTSAVSVGKPQMMSVAMVIAGTLEEV